MLGELVEHEGFEFVAVLGVTGAEVEGGELVREGGLGGYVGFLLAEGFDVLFDDAVVSGFFLGTFAEGGADGHEGVEPVVELGVVDDGMAEVEEVGELLVFLGEGGIVRLFLVHPAGEDGEEGGFDEVDEVGIEDDGVAVVEGDEVGGAVVDVDVLVVGEEFDGDAEADAVAFEMDVVHLSFESLEGAFVDGDLHAFDKVGIFGVQLEFLSIDHAAIDESLHHVVTDSDLLTFTITVVGEVGVTDVPVLGAQFLESGGTYLQEDEPADAASEFLAHDGDGGDEGVGHLLVLTGLHVCIVFVKTVVDQFWSLAGHDKPMELVFFTYSCSHKCIISSLCPSASVRNKSSFLSISAFAKRT